MLAIIVAVRWFHLLPVGAKMESPGARAAEDEEEAYIRSWRIVHKGQVISLFETERAY